MTSETTVPFLQAFWSEFTNISAKIIAEEIGDFTILADGGSEKDA